MAALLQGLEQAPLQRQERVLLQDLVQAQVRGLLRLEERRLHRYEGWAQFKARLQEPEPVPVRVDKRAQVRGQVIGQEREQERASYPGPERRLLRVPEQGPHKGQGLPQPSRGREKLGQCSSQNADTRSRNSRKGKDLPKDVVQRPKERTVLRLGLRLLQYR
ncbi:MAG: hypothetical protein NTX53_12430 [candidate division WOR-3 bacterium]|nr:hypothetical protein [candidate division WOR-3 bacterium]